MHNQKQSPPAGVNIQTKNGVSWIDIESPTREVFDWLETEYKLHPVHLTECTQKIQHNKVERESNYLFLVMHTPVEIGRYGRIHVSQVGIFLGKESLITIRANKCPAITNQYDMCYQRSDQSDEYFKRGAGYVLYILINSLLDDISSMTDRIGTELDEIEDQVFDTNASDAQRIGKIRQKIVRLRRLIGPKRFVLQDLADQVDDFTGQNMSKFYSSNTKTVNKLWEVIEEAKETVEIFKDADFTARTEKTNEILAVLTIVFTFTIPITVVGTLYGMNVPLPGGIEAGAWTFMGDYTTFGVVVIVSFFMALAMYLYFRSKRWF